MEDSIKNPNQPLAISGKMKLVAEEMTAPGTTRPVTGGTTTMASISRVPMG